MMALSTFARPPPLLLLLLLLLGELSSDGWRSGSRYVIICWQPVEWPMRTTVVLPARAGRAESESGQGQQQATKERAEEGGISRTALRQAARRLERYSNGPRWVRRQSTAWLMSSTSSASEPRPKPL